MRVDVVVPWRPGDQHRERAFIHTATQWVADGHRVVIGRSEHGWSKPRAIRDGAWRTTAPVVAVADADVWCDLTTAVEVTSSGGWAVPFSQVCRLTAAATEARLAGRPPADFGHIQQPTAGGGLVVAHRDVLLDCLPDPRFTGWGHEDTAWGWALTCLYGEPWWGDETLWHLWHPHEPLDRREVEANTRLIGRYRAARRDPDRMRALVEETYELPHPDAPPPRHRPPVHGRPGRRPPT